MALSKLILGGGAQHVQSMKALGIQSSKNWYSKKFKVIFNRESWVSMRSNGIGVEERHPPKTLLAAMRITSNWLVRNTNLLLFLLPPFTSVLFFVLVIST